jgi:hypothetical protein
MDLMHQATAVFPGKSVPDAVASLKSVFFT